MRKPSEVTFGKAFAAAKSFGMKEFTWKGKKYHTRTKDEEGAKAKASKKPTVKKPTAKAPSVMAPSAKAPKATRRTNTRGPTLKPKAVTVKKEPAKEYTPWSERIAAAGKTIDAAKKKPAKKEPAKKVATKAKRRTTRRRTNRSRG